MGVVHVSERAPLQSMGSISSHESVQTKPMSDPTQNDIPLPPVHVAELDEAGVHDLFDDLIELRISVVVSTKGAPTQRGTDPRPLTLVEARDLFLAGAVQGVQLRYRHEDSSWCDTLLRLGLVFRIVRIREEDVLAGAEEGGAP